MTEPLRVGALFAGYGGLEMGLAQVLDLRVAWYAENDPAASKVMAHHHPDVPNHGDVTKVDWSTVEPVDVLTGGFPCQDVSHAGKRLGLRPETRSGLWSHMAYAIDKLRPRLVVAENVRGILSATADGDLEPCPWCVGDGPSGALRALGAVLGDLADLRYDAWWCGLRAADVGAAHGRFRVFVFATPADADSRRWEVGEGSHGREPDTVRLGADDLTLLPTPAVNDMGTAYTPQQWDEWTARMRAEHGNGNGHGKSLAIEAQRLLPTPVSDNSRGLPSATTDYASLPNVAASIDQQDWREYETAIHRHETAFGRAAPPPTEPGRNGQPRLSPAFVEWLMGLPAGHVTGVPGLTRNDQLKALGNGVVPQQATAAAWAYLEDVEALP